MSYESLPALLLWLLLSGVRMDDTDLNEKCWEDDLEYLKMNSTYADRRFYSEALYVALSQTDVSAVLYMLKQRSKCKVNEWYDESKGECICQEGWSGEDCSHMNEACAGVPKCLNGGVCTTEKVCQCQTGWEGMDCATYVKCNPNPCPYPAFQQCVPLDYDHFECIGRFPILVQIAKALPCRCDPRVKDCSYCYDKLCICMKGYTRPDINSTKCERSLTTCFSHDDCKMISDDLLCKHKIQAMSNKLSYLGDGPYCLCHDKERIDNETGLCMEMALTADTKYSKPSLQRRFGAVLAGLAIALCAGAAYLAHFFRTRSAVSKRTYVETISVCTELNPGASKQKPSSYSKISVKSNSSIGRGNTVMNNRPSAISQGLQVPQSRAAYSPSNSVQSRVAHSHTGDVQPHEIPCVVISHE